MTRAEQLAQKEARAKARLEKARKALTKVESEERAEDRKLRYRRRVAVGTLAETAGLCALDDATLTELFALLASLAEGPSPGAVLERLLGEEAPTLVSADGRHEKALAAMPQTARQHTEWDT